MSDQSRQQLRVLLENRKLKKALIERILELRTDWYENERARYEKAGLGCLPWDMFITPWQESLSDLFEEFILRKLPSPKSITVEDLGTAAFNQFAGVIGDAAIEEAYQRFTQHVLFLLFDAEIRLGAGGQDIGAYERALGEPFYLGAWCPSSNEEARAFEDTIHTLWDSDVDSGFSFIVLWEPPDSRLPDIRNKIEGYLYADASVAALRAAESQFRLFLPSVMKSFRMVQVAAPVDDEEGRRSGNSTCVGLDSLSYPTLVSGFGKQFIDGCISGYFAPQGTKAGSFDRRIGNAVHFLANADSQQNQSIGLALCFSAIEAIVCEGTTDVTRQVREGVAAALERDVKRRASARKAVKELYGIRSKTLHGESIDDYDPTWRAARELAAGVLAAAIEWRGYHRRHEQRDKRSDFVAELRKAHDEPDYVDGIPAEFRCFLPTSE